MIFQRIWFSSILFIHQIVLWRFSYCDKSQVSKHVFIQKLCLDELWLAAEKKVVIFFSRKKDLLNLFFFFRLDVWFCHPRECSEKIKMVVVTLIEAIFQDINLEFIIVGTWMDSAIKYGQILQKLFYLVSKFVKNFISFLHNGIIFLLFTVLCIVHLYFRPIRYLLKSNGAWVDQACQK